jgi:hypothetical protein
MRRERRTQTIRWQGVEESRALPFLAVVSRDTNRPWAADGVDDQLERDEFTGLQAVERRALMQIGTMKVDFASVAQSDEAVGLPDGNASDRATRVRAGRWTRRSLGSPKTHKRRCGRRRTSAGVRTSVTSEVLNGGVVHCPCRRPRKPSDALRSLSDRARRAETRSIR